MKTNLKQSLKNLIFSGIFMLVISAGYGQIKGVVVDENNEFMPGVSILIQGTTNGTTSDFDGLFELKGVEIGTKLEFSYVGYETKIITVETKKNLHIKMNPSIINMEEVILVGYSNKSKSEITSAVSVLNADQLNDVATNDVGSLLQGKVSGVQVIQNTGEPGAQSQIRIRGISTIKPGNDEPLYVVDGIIGGSFDPNDVESITVLKDAGATGMYGARANKGVIVVSTKTGTSGSPVFEFKSDVGLRVADHGNITMMDGADFYDWSAEQYRDPVTHEIDMVRFLKDYPRDLSSKNTNWVDKAFKPAVFQKYYLSARGRTEKLSYYFSGSYANEDGTFMGTGYERLNFRTNTTYRFSDRVTVKNNINISTERGNSFDYMDMYYTYLGVPWDNPFDNEGKPKYIDGLTEDWWSRDHINPFHTVENSNHDYKGFDVNYDLMFDFKITDWLLFKTNNRINIGTNKSHDFISPLAAGEYHSKGFVGDQQDMYYGLISTNLLNFNKKFGDHSLSAILGYEFQKDYYEYQSVQGSGIPEGFETPAVISREQKVDGSNSTDVFESLISQVNYNYENTFFLSASFRADATSNFPENNRIAYFPSVSGSWIATNMSFMEDNNWLSLLKLRASYGITGDPDIGAGRYLGLFNLNSHYNGNSAAVPYQLANPDLTWEKTSQLNFGVDLGLFERISLSFDMYFNTTNDLLVLAAQPLSQGFEYRWENNGVVKNQGFEITLSTINFKTDNFRWTTDFTFAKNKNELSGIDKEFYRTVNGISQIYRNGAELYTFVLPKWLGVDSETGAPLWEKIERDSNGNIISRTPTSDYAEAEPQEVGKALPDFTGGITSNMEFFNFTFYMNFAYQYGNDIYNFTRIFMDNDGHEPYYNNMRPKSDWSRWQHPGDNATHPSMQNNSLSKENSSRYLESGDFFKIRTVGLRYNLPQSWVTQMHLKDLAIGFNLNNVYTFTDFWGQDPEVTVAGESWEMPGVTDFKYPNNRQYLFNIDIKF